MNFEQHDGDSPIVKEKQVTKNPNPTGSNALPTLAGWSHICRNLELAFGAKKRPPEFMRLTSRLRCAPMPLLAVMLCKSQQWNRVTSHASHCQGLWLERNNNYSGKQRRRRRGGARYRMHAIQSTRRPRHSALPAAHAGNS
jgi:hypothetical protein